MRHRISVRPKFIPEGVAQYAVPGHFARSRHETAVTLAFKTHRNLFGLAYSFIQPDYFNSMPLGSGIYVCPFVPTRMISQKAHQPGDIDLLVIPYEADELVLHRTLAIEVKVVRATFANQAKSPNAFGFSQASALLELGFPYVAVAHLVVSDKSPTAMWRELGVARILDSSGRAELLPSQQHDCLPMDLMDRTFGRLTSVCPSNNIGLISAYVDATSWDVHGNLQSESLWYPIGKCAESNAALSETLLKNIGALFDRYPARFFVNPRFNAIHEASRA